MFTYSSNKTFRSINKDIREEQYLGEWNSKNKNLIDDIQQSNIEIAKKVEQAAMEAKYMDIYKKAICPM